MLAATLLEDDGVQAHWRPIENLAAIERNKSVAQNRRRRRIHRRHRGHSDR